MEWLIGLATGGVGATIASGVFELIKWKMNRKAKEEDDERTQTVISCTERGKEIAGIQKSIEALFMATKYLMYDRIKHLCETYIERGWITSTELEVLTEMHTCYHDVLDGNGFLDALMAQVRKLRVVTHPFIENA